jgi:hypothetical protein
MRVPDPLRSGNIFGLNDLNVLAGIALEKPIYTDIDYNKAWDHYSYSIIKVEYLHSNPIYTRADHLEWYRRRLNLRPLSVAELKEITGRNGNLVDGIISFDLFGTLIRELRSYEDLFFDLVRKTTAKNPSHQNNKPFLSFLAENLRGFREIIKVNTGEEANNLSESLLELDLNAWYARNDDLVNFYNSIDVSKKIIVSDTHHSKNFVLRLLHYFDVGLPSEIHLSSDYGATKFTGRIWQFIDTVDIHIGDNILSDIVMIRGVGKGILVE